MTGTHIDLNSCSCPEGFSVQGMTFIRLSILINNIILGSRSREGRGRGKICSSTVGTESLPAVCKCSDGLTFADLALDLCHGAAILNCACLN